jgi:hypothetical protein
VHQNRTNNRPMRPLNWLSPKQYLKASSPSSTVQYV